MVELMFVVTLLSMVLPAASLLREREHGTVEHLLAMPLRPLELMLAKVWPNTLIVSLGALLSLHLIVYGLFSAPTRGSLAAFVGGTVLFQLTTAGLGILLATVARTVAQVALLSILVVSPMMFLSGAWTPIESLPPAVRALTVLSPLRYYAEFTFGVILRGAPAALLWRPLVALAVLGAVFFAAGSLRFRKRFAAG
jgi:ABC-2 type transport system permease protein